MYRPDPTRAAPNHVARDCRCASTTDATCPTELPRHHIEIRARNRLRSGQKSLGFTAKSQVRSGGTIRSY
jgi:hypothetical protein